MSALLSEKVCAGCLVAKPLADFYRTARQILPRCKPCHNARCTARVRQSPARQTQQYQAKRRWTLAHPIAKRRHEHRQIFQNTAPAALRALETALSTLAQQSPA